MDNRWRKAYETKKLNYYDTKFLLYLTIFLVYISNKTFQEIKWVTLPSLQVTMQEVMPPDVLELTRVHFHRFNVD